MSTEPDDAVAVHLDTVEDPIAMLAHGDIEIEGRMPGSSNATFLVHVTHDGLRHAAIYKPLRGERPLWDFEPGLHRREVATYLMSEYLGLALVPPTVLREGPAGEGSVQWFVAGDFTEHYFTLFDEHPELHHRLREMAVLDVICNNTDRKSGHCIYVPEPPHTTADLDDVTGLDGVITGGSVWGIDHGLCFAADFKLRTVIWDFADDAIEEPLLERIAGLADEVPADIADLLADDEVAAIQGRARWCITHRRMPTDPTGRRYPWPLV